MRNTATRLRIHTFGPLSPLHTLPETTQRNYLCRYLADLGANTVLEEPNYFDRDFLSEYSAFYGISSAGYPNTCRRLHFFSGPLLTRARIRSAASGRRGALEYLQENYLGFVVVRPIPATPFGRTVLAWYPDQEPDTPRVTAPSRKYWVHIAGIRLQVFGLAWQQQDTGVGACATVGLWSMLHSSAFDDHHAIPTTAEITQAAHRTASLGGRVFPSAGLRIEQVCEAVKEHGLSPTLFRGDITHPGNGFRVERFTSSCAAFLRSGYPVLLIGEIEGGAELHAVCAVGFRSCAPSPVEAGALSLQDADIPYIYIHDDNLGPSVRFSIRNNGPNRAVTLKPDSPPPLQDPNHPDPIANSPGFTPHMMLVAAHNDIRTSPDTLHKTAFRYANALSQLIGFVNRRMGAQPVGLTASARLLKLAQYLTNELPQVLDQHPVVLGRVRLALAEKVPPMSLHIGLIRIGLDNSTPLVDILFDTTDSDRNHPAFAHVCYHRKIVHLIEVDDRMSWGVPVEADVTGR